MTDVLSKGGYLPTTLPGEENGLPLVRLVRCAWATYWNRQVWRATARLLYSLDERMLEDIGISREQIHLYARGRTREDR